jgi:ABC-type dipeptide/oligopeptide/nickel transport system permease component
VIRYGLRRLAQALATVAAGSLLVWALLAVSPGDPARQLLQAQGVTQPHPAELAQVRAELGLDRPAPAQYAAWTAGAVRGDLGRSWRTGEPVSRLLRERAGPTLRLTLLAVLLGGLAALPLAVLGALGAGRWPDALSRATIFGAASAPTFVIGLLVLELVVVRWGIGRVVADGGWSAALLPALPLAVAIAAEWARVIRSGLDDALAAGYSQVATARGVSTVRLVVAYGLPAAARPWLAVLGMTVGGLLAGAAVVETLFTWPGIGRELIHAIAARDVPVVQGIIAVGVIGFAAAAALADLAAAAIDPRLRS